LDMLQRNPISLEVGQEEERMLEEKNVGEVKKNVGEVKNVSFIDDDMLYTSEYDKWREMLNYKILLKDNKKKNEDKSIDLKEKIIKFEENFDKRINNFESKLIQNQHKDRGFISELKKKMEKSFAWIAEFEKEMNSFDIKSKINGELDYLSKQIKNLKLFTSQEGQIILDSDYQTLFTVPYRSSTHKKSNS